MAQEFTRCGSCGIIFANNDGLQTLCPRCRNEDQTPESNRDMLRILKNKLRDMQAQGIFLTVPQLSEQTKIPEEKIWHFIQSGEIDTASFDDPKVRDFLVKKRREQVKAAAQPQKKEKKPEAVDAGKEEKKPNGDSSAARRGFHIKHDD